MREKLKLLDLFSGIGGFSLGLERTGGFETVAFCEIEDYPRQVLARHWPEVPIYGDIRELSAARLRADGIRVDAICGGFPCQDISTAGEGAGIEGEKSGLWVEYARLIGELRPQVVFVENVAALLGRGLDRVLGDLAEIGYDAEWHCIPASELGAHLRRDRVWIVAYPECWPIEAQLSQKQPILLRKKNFGWEANRFGAQDESGRAVWATEPDVGRVADGIPQRVDRLKCLGNSVVPMIPYLIGRSILELYEF